MFTSQCLYFYDVVFLLLLLFQIISSVSTGLTNVYGKKVNLVKLHTHFVEVN